MGTAAQQVKKAQPEATGTQGRNGAKRQEAKPLEATNSKSDDNGEACSGRRAGIKVADMPNPGTKGDCSGRRTAIKVADLPNPTITTNKKTGSKTSNSGIRLSDLFNRKRPSKNKFHVLKITRDEEKEQDASGEMLVFLSEFP